MSTPDQRAHYRIRVPLRAVVSDRSGKNPQSCVIRDGNIAGCQIAVSRIEDLPDDICLQVEAFREKIYGRIVWRKTGRAGIEFQWSLKDAEDGERRRAPRRQMVIPLQIFDVGRRLSFNGTESGLPTFSKMRRNIFCS